MKIFSRFLLLVSALLMLQCQKDRDKYYEKPSWAGEPMYNVLQGEGRFDLYLQLVDRSTHLENFRGNGYWTVFAPNDDAMNAYLNLKGYESVKEMPVEMVEKIVGYSMLFTKYPMYRLTDVLSGGWDTLKSIKKKTPYYETMHREYYEKVGDSVWVVNPTTYGSFGTNDNNYKYLPLYMTRSVSAMQPSDYELFYPSSTYKGRNVQQASILNSDMEASNGIIHEVDCVNEPLPNLEDLLKGDEYSKFRELLEIKTPTGEPFYYTYATSEYLKEYYRNMYPSRNINAVYCKFYNVPTEFLRAADDRVAVPFNVERYFLSGQELGGYTVFAPNNAAVQKFYDEVVSNYADEGYTSVLALPNNVRRYFINAQLNQTMIWPSEYKRARNAYENFINGRGISGYDFNPSNYPDLKPASNGLFYGSNTYVKTHWFETVLTEILLRPSKYQYMANALQKYFPTTLWEDFVRCPLNDFPDNDYTVLLLSDEQLKTDGFNWYWPTGQAAYDFSHGSSADGPQLRMERLMRSHTFKRMKADSIGNFMGDPSMAYDGYAYALNDYGDMIRYKDGKLQMIGNQTANEWVTATLVKHFSNGRVFTVDKPLQYSARASEKEITLVEALEQAVADNPNISIAANWLIYLLTMNASPLTINTAVPTTILLPTDTAMRALQLASRQTFIMGEGSAAFTCNRYKYQTLEEVKKPANAADPCFNALQVVDDMKDFFRFHVISGTMYINDNLPNVALSSGESYSRHMAATTYKDGMENTLLTITKNWEVDDQGNSIYNNLHFSTVGTAKVYEAAVVKGVKRSNIFGPKVVVHEVSSCLLYPPAIGK